MRGEGRGARGEGGTSRCHPERVVGWEGEGSCMLRCRAGCRPHPRREKRYAATAGEIPRPSRPHSQARDDTGFSFMSSRAGGRVGRRGILQATLPCRVQAALEARKSYAATAGEIPRPSHPHSQARDDITQRLNVIPSGWSGGKARDLAGYVAVPGAGRTRDPKRATPPQPERSLAPTAHTPLLGMTPTVMSGPPQTTVIQLF
jgi:hypothetical protein